MNPLDRIFDSTESRAAQFIANVYLRMTIALLAAAAIGYVSIASGLIQSLVVNFGRAFSLGIFATQILTVVFFQSAIFRMDAGKARLLFGVYTAVTGLTLGLVGLIYTVESILQVAFLSTTAFAALVAYGKMTKRDLGPIGTFMLSALTMLMVYSLLVWAVSFIPALAYLVGPAMTIQAGAGCIIFSGITAYESQKLKQISLRLAEHGSDQEVEVYVTSAALNMFMNFIGLFLSLMRLLGNRK